MSHGSGLFTFCKLKGAHLNNKKLKAKKLTNLIQARTLLLIDATTNNELQNH